eukprot:319598-Karenia_brevis.AAC.1
MDEFEGGQKVFRSRMSNLGVAIGEVDKELAEEIRKLVARDDVKRFQDDWNPQEDLEVDKVVYDKYSIELYGVLASLTTGKPWSIVQGLGDTKYAMDGYKA